MYPRCVDKLETFGWALKPSDPTVVVGDIANVSFYQTYGFMPRVSVIDGRGKGQNVPFIFDEDKITHTVYCKPGTASPELNEAVYDAIQHIDERNSVILVIGEEDAASSLAMLHAPDGAYLFYGSPDNNTIVGVICGKETRYIATTELFGDTINYRTW